MESRLQIQTQLRLKNQQQQRIKSLKKIRGEWRATKISLNKVLRGPSSTARMSPIVVAQIKTNLLRFNLALRPNEHQHNTKLLNGTDLQSLLLYMPINNQFMIILQMKGIQIAKSITTTGIMITKKFIDKKSQTNEVNPRKIYSLEEISWLRHQVIGENQLMIVLKVGNHQKTSNRYLRRDIKLTILTLGLQRINKETDRKLSTG